MKSSFKCTNIKLPLGFQQAIDDFAILNEKRNPNKTGKYISPWTEEMDNVLRYAYETKGLGTRSISKLLLKQYDEIAPSRSAIRTRIIKLKLNKTNEVFF